MRVETNQTTAVSSTTQPRKTNAGSEIFSGLLKKSLRRQHSPTPSPWDHQTGNTEILIGKLSDRTPTVSHLLAGNPELGRDTWQIIYNQVNQKKDFTQIPHDATITMNRHTREISWHSSEKIDEPQPVTPQPAPVIDQPDSIELGRVSDAQPTISHILARHPAYGKEIWQIIYNDINQGKDFTRVPHGATVTMNPLTRELSWEMAVTAADNPVAVPPPVLPETDPEISRSQKPDSFSAELVQAVRRHMGRPYRDLNCYTLIVQGLEEMGVRYSGRDGIYDKMVSLARQKGLAGNAYVTGEGLVEVSGTKVYARQISRPRNPAAQARAIYQEIEPLLEPGLVLSFSTRSRGHTGVVSQNEKQWTYINSGYIDNDIAQRPAAKRVGEERLSAEIANWLALASRRRESLTITMGRLHDSTRPSQPLMAKADPPATSG